MIYAKTTFFNFYLEIYLSNKKISNKKKMHLDAKSNHIFFISNFYAFRLFIDYWESTVQFKRRVPLFDMGIELESKCCKLKLQYLWCNFPELQYENVNKQIILTQIHFLSNVLLLKVMVILFFNFYKLLFSLRLCPWFDFP